jgi:hypothetical protein
LTPFHAIGQYLHNRGSVSICILKLSLYSVPKHFESITHLMNYFDTNKTFLFGLQGEVEREK